MYMSGLILVVIFWTISKFFVGISFILFQVRIEVDIFARYGAYSLGRARPRSLRR